MRTSINVMAATLIAVFALSGCAAERPTIAPAEPVAAIEAEPVTFTVVGDSITAGCQFPLTDHLDPCTWPYWVDRSEDLTFVGGWARGGAVASEMAANVPATGADIAVILAGTNDVYSGFDFAVTEGSLDQIVAASGAGSVVLLALPPQSAMAGTGRIEEWNFRLHVLADSRGWAFRDPWGEWTTMAGGYQWVAGVAPDGVHPNLRVQRALGAEVRVLVESFARSLND